MLGSSGLFPSFIRCISTRLTGVCLNCEERINSAGFAVSTNWNIASRIVDFPEPFRPPRSVIRRMCSNFTERIPRKCWIESDLMYGWIGMSIPCSVLGDRSMNEARTKARLYRERFEASARVTGDRQTLSHAELRSDYQLTARHIGRGMALAAIRRS